MNLHNFERLVEEKILERGFDYYENDAVEVVEQLEKGEFSAVVSGSEEYEVFVKLNKQQEIIDSYCDCPYDWGNVCKHEVAVYYYIKDSEIYKEKLSEDAVNLMLKIDAMTNNELKSSLHTILKRNRTLREDFLNDLI